MASAATSLIPIHQVKAQAVPDLGVYPGFPPNPNGEICGQAGEYLLIPYC